MKVHDVVYGEFNLPSFLEPLVWTPEFQRLQRVRLINVNSPSLASLADASRYSHTLGVLRMALENPLLGLDESETKAFLASLLVHDAGTPAFAHLFEYLLKERFNWDHESVVGSLIKSEAHADGHLRQLYRSQAPKFEESCRRAGIDFELVSRFVVGDHHFSRLIFGSLDFDNLDNVLRMNVLLGNNPNRDSFMTLSRNLSVTSLGKLALGEQFRQDVERWSEYRKLAYERLVYDEFTVARQAVLSYVIESALNSNHLNEGDWDYDDEHLIHVLLEFPEGKTRLVQDFFGEPPRIQFLAQLFDDGSPLFSMPRAEIVPLIERFVKEKHPKASRVYGYVFRDKGTFSKRLEFLDQSSQKLWSFGENSRSLVLYGFAKPSTTSNSHAILSAHQFLDWLGAML